jgi:hypothetical protein
MSRQSLFNRIVQFIFLKLFKVNDSPHKISLGLGLGVFAGLMPGTGPAAALFLAFVFKANRAAALFGGLLTNTWLSIVTFILAIKVGSVILNMNWQAARLQIQAVFKDFGWAKLLKLSFLEVILPLILGYLVIGLVLGVISYFLTFFIIRRNFHGNQAIHQ